MSFRGWVETVEQLNLMKLCALPLPYAQTSGLLSKSHLLKLPTSSSLDLCCAGGPEEDIIFWSAPSLLFAPVVVPDMRLFGPSSRCPLLAFTHFIHFLNSIHFIHSIQWILFKIGTSSGVGEQSWSSPDAGETRGSSVEGTRCCPVTRGMRGRPATSFSETLNQGIIS